MKGMTGPCTGVITVSLILIIYGCTGMSSRQGPPVVDRGVMAPGQATSTAQESPGVETRPLPGYEAAPQGTPLGTDGETPAVVALLEHAEQQANAGDLDAAAVTLERAIRIDSRNPVLWHHLATVRLADGDPVQAEQLAAKSNSLAGSNPALQSRNWSLIARARQARGDIDGARSAERQAQALQRQ